MSEREYRLYFETGAGLSITVEADDLESAIEKAYELIPRGICAQCSGWDQPWAIDLGEWEVDDTSAQAEYGDEDAS